MQPVMKTAVAVLCLCSTLAAEDYKPKLIDLSKIAMELKFPQDALVIQNSTNQTQKQLGPSVIHSELLSGAKSNTFHPISFIVALPSSLLSDDFIKRVDSSIAKDKDSQKKAHFKRFDLADGSWGYIGIEGIGPHGVLFSSTFTDSKRSIDVKLILACGFQELSVVPGGESYGKMFSGEIDATLSFLEIVQDVIRVSKKFRLPIDLKEADAAAQASSGRNASRLEGYNEGIANPPSTRASERIPFIWHIAATLFALVIFFTIRVLLRKKR